MVAGGGTGGACAVGLFEFAYTAVYLAFRISIGRLIGGPCLPFLSDLPGVHHWTGGQGWVEMEESILTWPE